MRVEPKDLATLTAMERSALGLAKWMNESPRVQRATHWLNTTGHRRWMKRIAGRRLHMVGIENMSALRPDRGVLLASNHRSFFDMYMITTHLYSHIDFCDRFFFPVRSGFWYSSPVGVLLNLAMSSATMYPPVFRESEKRGVSRAGLDFLAEQLRLPGTMVGIHPEGTRNKSADPYALLPAEPGFGRVALQAMPIVVPIFVNGMDNNFAEEALRTFGGHGRPIFIVFGKPVDLSEFDGADPHRLRTQVQVGRKVLGEIAKLGEVERECRRELQ